MTQKINQEVLFAGGLKGSDELAGLPVTPGTGTTVASRKAKAVQHYQLYMSGASIAVDESDDYGSVKICDLPDTNIHLLGVEVNLTLTKGGTTNGIVAATDLDVGVGTAAASATTLATTMIDIIEKADLDTNALAVEFEAHTQGQSTATMPKQIGDGASSALYLNAVAVGGITASDTISVTGTVDLYYVDLGNEIS